jgi:predicted PurR-regulated permease PerM
MNPEGLPVSARTRQGLSWGNAIIARTLRAAVVAGLGLLGLYLCYRLALPFFTPLAAAFILAVLFAPAHDWISTYVKHRDVAAFISVFAIALLLLLLVVFLAAQLIHEIASGAAVVRKVFENGLVENLRDAHPKVAPMVQAAVDQLNIAGIASDMAAWLTAASTSMVRGSIVQIVGILLTFYLLYYFLRDRAGILAALRSWLPFSDAESDFFFSRAVDAVHATAYGMIVTGAALGLLGGVIFAVVGLPAPALWGAVMALFAILPVLGIAMIWIPAAAWLALNGHWPDALGLTTAFTALSIADTVIYPYLVGNRVHLHTGIAFIAALGGVIVFGAVGFVAGPIAISLTIALKDVVSARIRAGDSGSEEIRL